MGMYSVLPWQWNRMRVGHCGVELLAMAVAVQSCEEDWDVLMWTFIKPGMKWQNSRVGRDWWPWEEPLRFSLVIVFFPHSGVCLWAEAGHLSGEVVPDGMGWVFFPMEHAEMGKGRDSVMHQNQPLSYLWCWCRVELWIGFWAHLKSTLYLSWGFGAQG